MPVSKEAWRWSLAVYEGSDEGVRTAEVSFPDRPMRYEPFKES